MYDKVRSGKLEKIKDEVGSTKYNKF